MYFNKKEVKINKGTAILQAIQQIITSSSYLENALSEVYTANEEPDPDSSGEDEIKNKKPREISWYNVSAEVKCLGYDTVVSDFAFETTYIIQPYSTPVVMSAYVKSTPRYYGPHKRYEYWFTGKNSEILNYSQTMDNTYFTVAVNPGAADSKSKGGSQNVPVIPNKQQSQPKQGELNLGKEAQNSYMTSLFDPGSYAEAKIQILGDPDYLMCESSSSINAVYNQFYAADGFTINPNGGQVFIEINFKEPQDYQNSTGLQSINESILFYKYPASVEKDIKSRGGGVSYMVKNITHTFSKGKFIQDLECVINTFDGVKDDDIKSGAGRPIASENQSSAESARLSRGSQTSAPSSNDDTTSGTGFTSVDESTPNSDSSLSSEPTTNSTQQTSPTGGAAPAAASPPASPPAFVLPNPSPTARTTFAGAMIKAYEAGVNIFVPVFLPSGLELTNVRGWGPAQWDAQIARADPRDLEALTGLKANYDTVIQPLIDEVTAKVAANSAARKEYDTLLANWGKTAGTSSSSGTNRGVADDDASGSSTSSSAEGGREN